MTKVKAPAEDKELTEACHREVYEHLLECGVAVGDFLTAYTSVGKLSTYLVVSINATAISLDCVGDGRSVLIHNHISRVTMIRPHQLLRCNFCVITL